MEQSPENLKAFRGRTEHGLDGKGRLNIPARFRDVLGQTYDDSRLIITSPWTKCLRVYPLQEWAKLEAKLVQRAQENPDAGRIVGHLLSGVIETTVDKNGRILLPIGHRTEAGLSKDVVLAGLRKYFTIWDKDLYEAENSVDEADFSTVSDLDYL